MAQSVKLLFVVVLLVAAYQIGQMTVLDVQKTKTRVILYRTPSTNDVKVVNSRPVMTQKPSKLIMSQTVEKTSKASINASLIPLQREHRSIVLLNGWRNYAADPNNTPKHISCLQKYICSLKTSESLVPDNRSDLVVFHGHGLSYTPPKKTNGQLWAFRSGESQMSLSTNNTEPGDGLFNYTIDINENATFRTYVHKYRKKSRRGSRNFYQEKLKVLAAKNLQPTALWFVSNCNSDGAFKVGSARAEYANKLGKSIDISIYSKKLSNCRENQFLKTMIKNETDQKQPSMSDFTFYLSFENALCKQYITEKLWKILTGNDIIIPVVMGGLSTKDYESIAPPNSFIDVRNFTSPENLAEHLRFVAGNPDAFNYYQQWRNEFTFTSENGEFMSTLRPKLMNCCGTGIAWGCGNLVFNISESRLHGVISWTSLAKVELQHQNNFIHEHVLKTIGHAPMPG